MGMADGTRDLTDDELAAHYEAIYGGDIDTTEQDAIAADQDFEVGAAQVTATLDPDDFIEWDDERETWAERIELELRVA
jgi:hypothetical protein